MIDFLDNLPYMGIYDPLSALNYGQELLTGDSSGGPYGTWEMGERYRKWISDTQSMLLALPDGEKLTGKWLGLPSPLFVRDPCTGRDGYDQCEFLRAVEKRNRWLGQLAGQLRPSDVERHPIMAPAPDSTQNSTDPQTVFVVHGRNDPARDSMFAFLRSIGLKPLEWTVAVQATGKPCPYIGEILDSAFSRAQAVVVLMTPDDEARLRPSLAQTNDPPHEKDLTPQARANVLFEAGMAMGRCPDRTLLVELGRLRPFSDIGGRHTIRLDDSSQRRQELAQRLQVAGCPVNLIGTDWHTAGDFSLVESPAPPIGYDPGRHPHSREPAGETPP